MSVYAVFLEQFLILPLNLIWISCCVSLRQINVQYVLCDDIQHFVRRQSMGRLNESNKAGMQYYTVLMYDSKNPMIRFSPVRMIWIELGMIM